MGYISAFSSFTCNNIIDVHWTELGRKYLMSFGAQRTRSQIYYFSLSDTDKNYINVQEPAPGFIPDLTGDHTLCLVPTASNRVRNELTVEGNTGNNVIDYRSKTLKACDTIRIDCSRYYDMYPLDASDLRSSEILVDSIWTCIISNFQGSLT